ncbi:hypothetical protein ACFE04_001425 [Oxalis oulophora]
MARAINYTPRVTSNIQLVSPTQYLPPPFISRSLLSTCRRSSAIDNENKSLFYTVQLQQSQRQVVRATPGNGGIVPSSGDDDDGVSLGTMKLPVNTDLQRFEALLFQWANSLCQGANLPLPVPLKVDRVAGGVRLGFITIGDGETEVLVYIDCLVFPPTDNSTPIFRAVRNGKMKDKSPPGEPRIMRSLQQALLKSVQIAAV